MLVYHGRSAGEEAARPQEAEMGFWKFQIPHYLVRQTRKGGYLEALVAQCWTWTP